MLADSSRSAYEYIWMTSYLNDFTFADDFILFSNRVLANDANNACGLPRPKHEIVSTGQSPLRTVTTCKFWWRQKRFTREYSKTSLDGFPTSSFHGIYIDSICTEFSTQKHEATTSL